jgi:pyruvate dehydrogenase E2 component (dihydrolipoamide acetyltransferase)
MKTEIIIPDVGATGGDVRILAWLVRVGDFVSVGTPLVTIETDKATEDIEAFSDGYVEAIVADVGTEVPVGSVIATLRADQKQLQPEADLARRAAATSFPARLQTPAPVAANPRERATPVAAGPILASPAARRLAREKNIDLSSLSDGREGRTIHLRHVQQAISSDAVKIRTVRTPTTISREHESKEAASTTPSYVPTRSRSTITNARDQVDTSRESSSACRSRRAIAERVSQSKSEIPHFYMSTTIDMTEANRTRAWLNEASEKSPVIGPTINDLIVRAAAFALRDNPKLNALFRDDRVADLSSIDIGIVVGTENGVVIPIVPHVDQLDIYALAETTRALKDRALKGALTSREMKGGALSVSNLGMYGVEQFTAIIDPAQSSILACGMVQRRPAVRSDEIVVRELMTVTLSVDHRLADGVVAAEFLRDFQEYLEIPQLLITGKRRHER